jgi:hypothetical protein
MEPFWSHRDSLGIDNDGFIVKEGQLLVPAGLRQTYLKRLLAMHQQTEKMEARARKSIWWPFMNRDTKNIAKTCLPCQEKLPSQAPEPERAREEAYYPFHSLQMDLCVYEGHQFLIVMTNFQVSLTSSNAENTQQQNRSQISSLCSSRHTARRSSSTATADRSSRTSLMTSAKNGPSITSNPVLTTRNQMG